MQHVPRLQQILVKLARNKLSPKNFPVLKQQAMNGGFENSDRVPPQEIVIFFVGGVTYEEARLVSLLNKANPGLKCVIGGTSIINSDKFVENLNDVGSNWGGSTINRI
ncbi:unnamed protein product [Ambrosiozyma monospora]|uniref:Unnamed protein product n=1 Tax=Ambrosiozyma monospora TaxID=43982 RepID=A0ACB5T7Y0_AMBMO|nr:unnamed protein product [Ambrosiozyma monospora]